MNVIPFDGDLARATVDALGVMLPEGADRVSAQMDGELGSLITRYIAHISFKGSRGDMVRIPLLDNSIRNIYLIGIGKDDGRRSDNVRNAAAEFIRRAKRDEMKDVVLCPPSAELTRPATEGCVLGGYAFDKYRSKRSGTKDMDVSICSKSRETVERGVTEAGSQNFSRSLINEPGNVITPLSFAEEASRMADELGLKCTVLDEKEIQNEGMMGLWHVGKGSKTPPRLVHLTYSPEGTPSSRVVLVGKGVTFDSGGLTIKPRPGMRRMKSDKTGACNVLAVMRAVAELKPRIEVHAVMGMVENMPDGGSYRPDDIIRTRNGKTIEIHNCDAEGRVTLADTLAYASDLKPDAIVDMATLAGPTVTALGHYTAGLFSNSDKLANAILAAGRRAGERFHRFEMDDDRLREQIDTPFADVINSGGRDGGPITAGMFLREFVGEGISWVHLDIAGVDFYEKPFGCYPAGASAFGVRTCLEYILSI